jgi:hypothetical protein
LKNISSAITDRLSRTTTSMLATTMFLLLHKLWPRFMSCKILPRWALEFDDFGK